MEQLPKPRGVRWPRLLPTTSLTTPTSYHTSWSVFQAYYTSLCLNFCISLSPCSCHSLRYCRRSTEESGAVLRDSRSTPQFSLPCWSRSGPSTVPTPCGSPTAWLAGPLQRQVPPPTHTHIHAHKTDSIMESLEFQPPLLSHYARRVTMS